MVEHTHPQFFDVEKIVLRYGQVRDFPAWRLLHAAEEPLARQLYEAEGTGRPTVPTQDSRLCEANAIQ
jgi:hypothetical protein